MAQQQPTSNNFGVIVQNGNGINAQSVSIGTVYNVHYHFYSAPQQPQNPENDAAVHYPQQNANQIGNGPANHNVPPEQNQHHQQQQEQQEQVFEDEEKHILEPPQKKRKLSKNTVVNLNTMENDNDDEDEEDIDLIDVSHCKHHRTYNKKCNKCVGELVWHLLEVSQSQKEYIKHGIINKTIRLKIQMPERTKKSGHFCIASLVNVVSMDKKKKKIMECQCKVCYKTGKVSDITRNVMRHIRTACDLTVRYK